MLLSKEEKEYIKKYFENQSPPRDIEKRKQEIEEWKKMLAGQNKTNY